ncbi:MAG: metallophosphoesterase [Christensenellales bacterium]
MDFRIIDKYFSKEDSLFHIVREKKYTFEREEKTYTSFDKFYTALDKDLQDANLLDYDFEGIDLNKYDLTKAKISSTIMIKLGTYKDNLFKAITKDNQLANITPSTSLDLVPSRQLDIELLEENNFVLCYISDLHLNHKLLNKFKNSVNKFELDFYLKKVIERLKSSLPTFTYNYSIVFVGDISYNFEVFKLFFKAYRAEMPYQTTFVVLGNHELWDIGLNKNCKTVEEIVESYRKFLNSFECKIHLLENQLFLPNDKQHLYSQEEIFALDKNVLRNKFLCNSYAIFGGIGYAGINEEFNFNQGIYRTQYITRKQEKERSNQVDALHKKLTEVAYDKKIFFITHMPKEDWSNGEYNKNWFYISGHTHRNNYIENEEMKLYADNQVGYTGDSYGFKYLMTSKEFDIFQDYNDGIYEITREQYKLFYYGIGNRIDFNRDFEKLFMLKRNETYCFLIKLNNSNDLKLLNGGSYKNVGKHDLNYFYENLVNYSNSVKLFLESYENFQKQISNEIKKIGGSGYIHGSIIDIDFYNHLYINPLDATITPYFAYSIVDKYVYTNLISLLKAHNKELYGNYIKLLGYEGNNNNLIVLSNNLKESNKKVFVPETDMYRISRILKGFQYTTKNNIVRLWNDTIASNSTKESGRLIVSGLINPEEMKQIKAEQKKIERQQRMIEYKKEKQKSKPCLTEKEKKKILFDKYCNKLSNLNKNIKVISYNGAREKAEYECLVCDYKWSYRPDHFSDRYKCKCPKCKK